MKKYFLFVSIIISSITMSGCNDKTSVEWYVAHHDDLIAKYTECILANSWHDPVCQNVRSAKNLEIDKPDIKQGLKDAYEKLAERRKSQPIADLNTLPK